MTDKPETEIRRPALKAVPERISQGSGEIFDKAGQPLMNGTNLPLARCPHCGIAYPLLAKVLGPVAPDGGRAWTLYDCSVC